MRRLDPICTDNILDIMIVVQLHYLVMIFFFFFQAEDGIRDLVRSRGLGDVYKRQGCRRRSLQGAADRSAGGRAVARLRPNGQNSPQPLSLIHI